MKRIQIASASILHAEDAAGHPHDRELPAAYELQIAIKCPELCPCANESAWDQCATIRKVLYNSKWQWKKEWSAKAPGVRTLRKQGRNGVEVPGLEELENVPCISEVSLLGSEANAGDPVEEGSLTELH